MNIDEFLFSRLKRLSAEVADTACVVQNDHERLAEDRLIDQESVRQAMAEFSRRMDRHMTDLSHLKEDVLVRLLEVHDSLSPASRISKDGFSM